MGQIQLLALSFWLLASEEKSTTETRRKSVQEESIGSGQVFKPVSAAKMRASFPEEILDLLGQWFVEIFRDSKLALRRTKNPSFGPRFHQTNRR